MDEEPAEKEPRLSLICIEEVKDFLLLCRELEKHIGKNVSFKALKNKGTSIKTCFPNDYRAVVKYLTEEKKAEGHSKKIHTKKGKQCNAIAAKRSNTQKAIATILQAV